MMTLKKLKLETMQQKRYQSYMLIAMQGMGFIYMSVVRVYVIGILARKREIY
jgi:hypothetical protein